MRRHEYKLLMAQGEECLKGTKHLWLMNEEHNAAWLKGGFEEIVKLKLKTAAAWPTKESLRRFLGVLLSCSLWRAWSLCPSFVKIRVTPGYTVCSMAHGNV
jgi:hypothetical protein